VGLFDDYKRIVEQNFNVPVGDFRRETKGLDANHYSYIQNFKNIMDGLFDPNVPFSGPAADALATLVGNYLRGEDALTGTPRKDDPGDHISELLDNTSRLCEQTVAHIREDLHKLPNGDPIGLEQGGLVLMGEKITPELLFRTGLPALLVTYAIISLQDQFTMDDVSNSRDQWENGMLQQGFAALAEPKLPPSPNDPTKILYPPQPLIPQPQNQLPPDQEKLAEELFQEYKDKGYTLDDIRALIERYPGLNPDQLRALLNRFSPAWIHNIVSTPINWAKVASLKAKYNLTDQQAISMMLLLDEHPGLTEANALKALTGPPGTTPVALGGGGMQADILFLDANGNIVRSRDVKVTIDTQFSKRLSEAVDQKADEVFMQMPAGTNVKTLLKRFAGNRKGPGQLDKYKNVNLDVVDPSGNVLYDGPVLTNP
jgi:hypothetical protein